MIYYQDEKITIRSMVIEDAKVYFDTYMSYGWHPQIERYFCILYNHQKYGDRGCKSIF